MTHRDIQWDKLDDFIEESKEKVSDFKRLTEIRKQKEELHASEQTLINEEKKIRDKYHEDYSNHLNDRLDKFGILTVVTPNSHYEGQIISVTTDEIKVGCYMNYDHDRTEYTISTKELKENGFVEAETPFRKDKVFIVDRITDPKYVYNIIETRLKNRTGELISDVEFYTKQIAEYTAKLNEITKELEKYKKVSDGMITKVFNEISFGVTDLKIEDILKTLPREICIYKGEK